MDIQINEDNTITIGEETIDIPEEIASISTGWDEDGIVVTAKDIQDKPEDYYGKEVKYTSANGQNNWEIFHSDGTYIYLITKSYVKITDLSGNINTRKLNAKTKLKKADDSSNYRPNWNDSDLPEFNSDISAEVISKFKIETNIFNLNNNKDNINSKCVASLLNTNYWDQYIDNSKGSDQYAIGGPTLELWVQSWNNRYKSPSDKLYYNASNEYGYYIGFTSEPKGGSTMGQQSAKTEDGGELYFPKEFADGNYSVDRYWIASPAAAGNSEIFIAVSNGIIGSDPCVWGDEGLRPVVCLKSKVTLK